MATAGTAIAALWFTGQSLRATEQQYSLSERGQVTDRFTKAVEQLGSDKPDVRLGGIYSLERLAQDSPADHPVIIELLTAFIRSHAESPCRQPTPTVSLPQDVQAALTVVGRRNVENDGPRLVNLSDTCLAHANLYRANFAGLSLFNTDLTDANLNGINLAAAVLDGAHLSSATLGTADLSGASLNFADLTGANFTFANLTGARFSSANLTGASLDETNFTGANLGGANLTGASLRGATLAGANLALVCYDGTTIWPEAFVPLHPPICPGA
ncbi:pentapeptide repeat-containing protein [Nocardia sp. NPDC057663]|uniref:pentapeptide repeat-containing protein n=1 Tax=Nocardia sp. NPDC057663 TaxID=3346201 RepID=UPI003671E32D